MAYKLGRGSRRNLKGVNANLVAVVELAIGICKVDFSVVDGLRTIEEQKKNIEDGVSWTMDSYHLPDENEESNAVDLYPWVNSKTDHDPKHYKYIARAMFKASQILGVTIEWGGLWRNREDLPHWQKVSNWL